MELYWQCYQKTSIVHQTFAQWALYILFKIVKYLIRHWGLAIGNIRHVWWFSWALYWLYDSSGCFMYLRFSLHFSNTQNRFLLGCSFVDGMCIIHGGTSALFVLVMMSPNTRELPFELKPLNRSSHRKYCNGYLFKHGYMIAVWNLPPFSLERTAQQKFSFKHTTWSSIITASLAQFETVFMARLKKLPVLIRILRNSNINL